MDDKTAMSERVDSDSDDSGAEGSGSLLAIKRNGDYYVKVHHVYSRGYKKNTI